MTLKIFRTYYKEKEEGLVTLPNVYYQRLFFLTKMNIK